MADYDAFAEPYGQWTATPTEYTRVELHSFFDVLGSVAGLDVLELACGHGRISRMLAERGARSVHGIDVSAEMIRRARAQGPTTDALRYEVVDATDAAFQLDAPVDVVAAVYLLSYAPNADDVGRMCRLVSRNLAPNGRFVTYTPSPDYDFSIAEPRLAEQFGFDYEAVGEHRRKLIMGGESVDFWQWSRETHEDALTAAGLDDIRWHALRAPPGDEELTALVGWYLERPSCVVLSAVKPS